MQEQIHTWLTEKMKVSGVLACGIRSPDRKTVTRSNSNQFTSVGLENACRCLSDTIQVLNSNRFKTEIVRWVYENYFLYGVVRPDGHCLALLTRCKAVPTLQQQDLERIAAEFQQLEP
jgi:hypothetical protein